MAKTYLPQNMINNNYRYTISNDSILVHTNNNCYTQYNTTYCDCYYVYPKLDYLVSNSTTCNYNPTTYVNNDNFTSDYWYRIDLSSILIIFLILFIVIFSVPFKLIQRLFGRWLKL